MIKTTNEIRKMFLEFFYNKDHKILESSSLIPKNDNTLLFTNAGMNQFKNIFLGSEKAKYPRIVTTQKCLRTGGKHNDIENVGNSNKHHTFFEMLGNFSFNDYFKKEAINYAWELLTSKKWFNLPKENFIITIYKTDKETYKIWLNDIGINKNNLIKIGDNKKNKYCSDNFWQMGKNGPCGPCTEIYYNNNTKNTCFKKNKEDFIEVWNIVFMQFNKISHDNIKPLRKSYIDTGMGLERISAVLQKVNSNFKIDIFIELINHIISLADKKIINKKSIYIIADHIRSISFMIIEDITPSNEGRGYTLRKLIRRSVLHGSKIGIKIIFLHKLIPVLIKTMGFFANEIKNKKNKIKKIIKEEEKKFLILLKKGKKLLNQHLNDKQKIISGKKIFYLYDTFGIPIELMSDICNTKQIKLDINGFRKCMEKQKTLARNNNNFDKKYNTSILPINSISKFKGFEKHQITSKIIFIIVNNNLLKQINKNDETIIILQETCFFPESSGQKGDTGYIKTSTGLFKVKNTIKYGLSIAHIGELKQGSININDSADIILNQERRNKIEINHTATHLLNAALKKILESEIEQKGSWINDKYLRLDFTYKKNIKIHLIHQIENLVNYHIRKNHEIKTFNMKFEDACKKNISKLENKTYKSIVRVLSINKFSNELCGGTHTKNTGNIGLFKIISCVSNSANTRRIEAVTGQIALDKIHEQNIEIKHINSILGTNNNQIKSKIQNLIYDKINLEKQVASYKIKEIEITYKKIIKNFIKIKDIKFIFYILDNIENKLIFKLIDKIKNKIKPVIIVIINKKNEKNFIIISISNCITKKIQAKDIIKIILKKTNGKGGGGKNIAIGGNINLNYIEKAINNLKLWINQNI